MKEINTVMYVIGIIITFCSLLAFAEGRLGFGIVILVYWLFIFAWDYYREFHKPKDERAYARVALSFGFMLGLVLGFVVYKSIRTAVGVGLVGLLAAFILWRFTVEALGVRYPYLHGPVKDGDGEGRD